MTGRIPEAVIIGGPNGAGKSTFARYVLPESMSFLNADEIAKALPNEFVGNRDLEAGRQLLNRIKKLSEERRSFAVETTLASRSLIPRLRALRSDGYLLLVMYVWIPAPELSVERVALRVRRGGHDIPTDTIFRRYVAGLQNLFSLYIPITDRWRIYSNAGVGRPRIIVSGQESRVLRVYDKLIWNVIQGQVTDDGKE